MDFNQVVILHGILHYICVLIVYLLSCWLCGKRNLKDGQVLKSIKEEIGGGMILVIGDCDEQ